MEAEDEVGYSEADEGQCWRIFLDKLAWLVALVAVSGWKGLHVDSKEGCMGELKEIMWVWWAGHTQVAGSFNPGVTNTPYKYFLFWKLKNSKPVKERYFCWTQAAILRSHESNSFLLT